MIFFCVLISHLFVLIVEIINLQKYYQSPAALSAAC